MVIRDGLNSYLSQKKGWDGGEKDELWGMLPCFKELIFLGSGYLLLGAQQKEVGQEKERVRR